MEEIKTIDHSKESELSLLKEDSDFLNDCFLLKYNLFSLFAYCSIRFFSARFGDDSILGEGCMKALQGIKVKENIQNLEVVTAHPKQTKILLGQFNSCTFDYLEVRGNLRSFSNEISTRFSPISRQYFRLIGRVTKSFRMMKMIITQKQFRHIIEKGNKIENIFFLR